MDQLTIRGFTPELEQAIRTTAKRRGISMNKAALYLMRRGAGLRQPEEMPSVIGDALDSYFGALSDAEAAKISSAVSDLDRANDEAFWK